MGVDPLTLALVSGAFTAASGVASMSAANQSAGAEMQMYENQRATSEYNKQVTDQDRLNSRRATEIALDDKQRENRRLLASLRAANGASGFEMAGSPLEVLQDTSIEMGLDERRIEYEGEMRNREYVQTMNQYGRDAKDASSAIKNTKKAAKTNTVASFLSMGSQAASTAYTYKTGRAI